jgi:hypothetical protein
MAPRNRSALHHDRSHLHRDQHRRWPIVCGIRVFNRRSFHDAGAEMNALLASINPFVSDSALAPAMAAGSTATPDLTDRPVVAVANSNSAPLVASCGVDTAVASHLSPPAKDAAAEPFSESQAKATEGTAGMAGINGPVRRSSAGTGLRLGEASADLPATSEIMDVAAGETAPNSFCQTQYIPELFSVFAARRSFPVVSPPLPYHAIRNKNRFEPDMDALFDAMLPPEPPIFLRKPSPAFLRSLLQLAGVSR